MSFTLNFTGADGTRTCNCCNCCDVLGNEINVAVSGGLTGVCEDYTGSYDQKTTTNGSNATIAFGSAANVGDMDYTAYNSTDGTCSGGVRASGTNNMSASVSCDKSAKTITVTVTQLYVNLAGTFIFNCETLAPISSAFHLGGDAIGADINDFNVTLS